MEEARLCSWKTDDETHHIISCSTITDDEPITLVKVPKENSSLVQWQLQQWQTIYKHMLLCK